MKFTKDSIEKLALPKAGERLIIWETGNPGFGLRLTPSGKMYIAQARVNGTTRRVSLGRHGALTLDEARKEAKKALAKMLTGKDPNLEKKRDKVAALTLRQVSESYQKDRKRKLKASTKADIEKHLKTSFSDWADKPIISITRDKVARRFRELSEKSAAQSNLAFRILRALLNYAMGIYRPGDKPMIMENPCRILSDAKLWNRIQPRAGRIPTDKIGLAWNLLQGLREAPEQTTVTRTLADITCFLLLTGARWTEAAQLTWDRVNLDEAFWYLPDPKNRNPVRFPLSHTAREILSARPQAGKYVFPGRTGKKGYIGDARGVFGAISKAIEAHITAHDLRRTFRAIAGECGLELWKAKLLMNHRLTQDVTISHYTETSDLRYLAPEINKIASWVIHQSLIVNDANVVQLPVKGGNRGE